MKHALARELLKHLDTAERLWQIVPLSVVLVPVAAVALILALDATAVAPYLVKEVAEEIAPCFALVALLLAGFVAVQHPEAYLRWQALFALCVFLRELHFRGTNAGFYIAAGLLVWWASRYRERLEPFVSSKAVVTAFAATLWTYLTSKMFDRHMWDWALPSSDKRNVIEENLETVGHVLLILTIVLSWQLVRSSGTPPSASIAP